MSLIQIAFLILIFLAVFGVTAFAMMFFQPTAAQERLRGLVPPAAASRGPGASNQWVERAAKLTARFGKLSIPEEGWEQSGIRTRFMNAGIHSASAPMVYFGLKTILAICVPGLVYLYLAFIGSKMGLNSMLVVLLVVAAIAYYLPNLVLSHLVMVRQREIFETFPDALDLMTVCVEAGLGVEAALDRVADDIRHKSEVLSEELSLVGLELRAGSDRERALRNLATRTGVDEVEAWVALIIQAERFGTSIGAALRIHSDMLRTKRRQRAEEAAAKIALKLLFPLIFCIFPSLLLVLLGPAFIQIYRVLLPTMAGGG
ncbi:type II secretion system F family protein [Propionivibrio limicola]|uniref:type II secretion system F family protein n=1 Tax=Propionivibrio limicola TaxID=167645 RepID=UPI0012927030|nr:type II secretion system F family protein [Propionivibrio limicola]